MIDNFEYLFERTATKALPRGAVAGYFRKIQQLEAEIITRPGCEQINKQTIEKLRNIIVTSNLRLIISMVRMSGLDPSHTDKWYSAGCVGLTRAVNTFDVDFKVGGKPVAFTTYACRCIKMELMHELEHHSGMWRRSLTNKIWAVSKAMEYLAAKGVIRPTDEELLAAIRTCWEIKRKAAGKGIKQTTRYATPLITTLKDVHNCRKAQAVQQVDMFGANGTGGLKGHNDQWAPEDRKDDDVISHVDNHELANIILDSVDDRTRDILCLEFGIGCDKVARKDIGQKYGVSRQRLHQIIAGVKKTVQANFTSPYESPICRQTAKFPQHGSSPKTSNSVFRNQGV